MTYSQRNYFNDLFQYSQYFNILTIHGSTLSFVRNNDPLLVHCGFTNKRDLSCCLQVFGGKTGHVVFKPHEGCYYSYLSISTSIIDDSREYDSTFLSIFSDSLMYSFHAKPIEKSSYSTLLQQLMSSSSSPHTRENLHRINALHHSLLCRDIFNTLLAGCTALQRAKGKSIEGLVDVCDNALTFSFDNSLLVRIQLMNADDVLVDPAAFEAFIGEECSPIFRPHA